MFRRTTLLLLSIAVVGLASVRSADAAAVSSRNPYRSFNISGVNYGSMRWERTHRAAPARRVHHGGFFFRR